MAEHDFDNMDAADRILVMRGGSSILYDGRFVIRRTRAASAAPCRRIPKTSVSATGFGGFRLGDVSPPSTGADHGHRRAERVGQDDARQADGRHIPTAVGEIRLLGEATKQMAARVRLRRSATCSRIPERQLFAQTVEEEVTFSAQELLGVPLDAAREKPTACSASTSTT